MSLIKEYIPSAPYVIKNGKRKGLSLEKLMFSDYRFLLLMQRVLDKKKEVNPFSHQNEFEQHLRWILTKGENRTAVKVCPQCKERHVRFFSAEISEGELSIGVNYTSCGEEECLQKLKSLSLKGHLLIFPFKFSSMAYFAMNRERKEIADLFKIAFEIPRRARAKTLFRFFST